MSAIEFAPPPEGSYAFVLRRYDKDCIHKIAAYTYDEATESRAIELGGVTAHTLFLSSQPARDYWVKLGWRDETARWMASLAPAPDVEEAPAGATPVATKPAAPEPVARPPLPPLAGEVDPLVVRARELVHAAGKTLTIGQLIAKLGAPEAQVRAALHAGAEAGHLTERGTGSIVVYGLPAEAQPDATAQA